MKTGRCNAASRIKAIGSQRQLAFLSTHLHPGVGSAMGQILFTSQECAQTPWRPSYDLGHVRVDFSVEGTINGEGARGLEGLLGL